MDATTSPLATALDARRKAAGMPLKTLAEAAGVGYGNAHRALAGAADSRPPVAVVVGLARGLGLTPGELGQMLYDAFPGPTPAPKKKRKKNPDMD